MSENSPPRKVPVGALPRDVEWEKRLMLQFNVEAALTIAIFNRNFEHVPEFSCSDPSKHLVFAQTDDQSVVKKLTDRRNELPTGAHIRGERSILDLAGVEASKHAVTMVIPSPVNFHPCDRTVYCQLCNGGACLLDLAGLPFIKWYAILRDMTVRDVIAELAELFHIDGTPFCMEQGRGLMWQFAEMCRDDEQFCALKRPFADIPPGQEGDPLAHESFIRYRKFGIYIREFVDEESAKRASIPVSCVVPFINHPLVGPEPSPGGRVCLSSYLPDPYPLFMPARSSKSGANADSPEKTVMLTDSIPQAEGAHRFLGLSPEHLRNQEWISWYGGTDWIDRVDFSPLKGRNITYVLQHHSGLSNQEICRTAREARKHLDGDVSLKYLSCLDPGERVIDEDEFERLAKWYCEPECGQLGAPRGVHLFNPLIRERTMMALWGEPCSTAWLALSIAVSISQVVHPPIGFPLDWGPAKRVRTVYCRNRIWEDDEFSAIYEKVCPTIPLLTTDSLAWIEFRNDAPVKPSSEWAIPLVAQLDYILRTQWQRDLCAIYDDPVFVVLDGLSELRDIGRSSKKAEQVKQLCEQLAMRNAAVLIVAPSASCPQDVQVFLNRSNMHCGAHIEPFELPFGGDIAFELDVMYGPNSPDASFVRQLVLNRCDPCCTWSFPQYAPPPDALRKARIRKLTRMGLRAAWIADMLTRFGDPVSPEVVRKTRERLGITKKRRRKRGTR